MAYTSAPEKQTYSSERISAAYNFTPMIQSNYDGLIYSGMKNVLPLKIRFDKEEETVMAHTRPSVTGNEIVDAETAPRGCYVWEKTPGTIYYFACSGTGIYTSTDAATWTAVNTWSTNVGSQVGFTEFIDGTNTKYLIVVDGVQGFVFTTNAAGTEITDPQFPTPHVPFPIFLDGYLFLAKKNTGDIYNSDLNDPTAWTAGSFISSEVYPDDLQALVKINNYILAVGTQGCEYFYDAANTTASPLARYEGGVLPFGCQIPSSIASNKNTAVFLTNDNTGELSLKVIEDFKTKDITPPWLSFLTNQFIASQSYELYEIRGLFLRQYGELFYVLKLGGISLTGYLTLLYSFTTGYWTLAGDSSTYNDWSVAFSAFGTTETPISFVQGRYFFTPADSFTYFGTISGTSLIPPTDDQKTVDEFFRISAADVTRTIDPEIKTPLFDFGTMNQKQILRFGIALETNLTTAFTVGISTYNDYYQSPTTSRNISIDPTTAAGADYPFITQLGRCRKIGFRITPSTTNYIRISHFEIDINKGQQ